MEDLVSTRLVLLAVLTLTISVGAEQRARGLQSSHLPPGPKTCTVTPSAIEGPFYKPGAPRYFGFRQNKSPFCREQGPVTEARNITVKGILRDACTGKPITRPVNSTNIVYIDIWQADNVGQYDNTQYNCRTKVRVEARAGRFLFRTIVPGRYGSPGCLRPAHIHLKASAPGYQTLTTQLYFRGDPFLGARDCGCGGMGNSCSSGNTLLHLQLDASSIARVDVRLRPSS